MYKLFKKMFLSILAIGMFAVILDQSIQIEAQQLEIIEVDVPAVWIPVDKDTNEVLDYLNPMPTYPDMYEQREAAKLVDDEYKITYRGAYSNDNWDWSVQHFSYTGNLFFTDRFHRVVAQGRNERNFDEVISAVRKIEYGDFTDEAPMNSEGKYVGLHGFISMEHSNYITYKDGETMKIYISTETDASLSSPTFKEENLNLLYDQDDLESRDAIYNNIEEVKFNDFDNMARITTLNGVNDQEGLRNRLNTIYLYKYNSVDSNEGQFIKDGPDYKDFAINSLDSLENGKYEVVLPIYWDRNVPNYMSAPDLYSRDRYKYDDTIHFTMNFTEAVKHTVTFEAGLNGSLEGDLVVSDILEGTTWNEEYVPTPVADFGYKFKDWTPEFPATVEESVTYIANFEKDLDKWHTVTFEAGLNGSLEGDLVISDILEGTAWNEEFVPTPVADFGYRFKDWTPEFPVTVEESVTYTANFEKDLDKWHTVTFEAGLNGSLEGDLVITDILEGTAWDDDRVPTPVANIDYEFKDWTPEFPSTIKESITFMANFIALSQEPEQEEITKIDITGSKVWLFAPEEKPTIELQLYRDEVAYGDPVELVDGVEEYTWTDLDSTDSDGRSYAYTVKEVEVPEFYDMEVSEDGLTITNTYGEVLAATTPDPTPETGQTPQTGIENNQAVFITLIVLSGAGLIVLSRKKKYKELN